MPELVGTVEQVLTILPFSRRFLELDAKFSEAIQAVASFCRIKDSNNFALKRLSIFGRQFSGALVLASEMAFG